MKQDLQIKDISQLVISNSSIEQNLALIFGDCIVLNTQFEVVNVSDAVLKLFNYELQELVGQEIGIIGDGVEFRKAIEADLSNGFFSEREHLMRTKNGHGLLVGLSGFYLGLISDINGYIILKIKNLDEVKRIYEQLEEKTVELDYFMYRTSHDIRGPLATIMGLANIALMEESDQQRKFYFEQILRFSEKLDGTLRNILYIADSGINEFEYLGLFNFDKIENVLKNIITNNDPNNSVEFRFTVDKWKFGPLSEIYILALLKNIIGYILTLPKSPAEQLVAVDVMSKERLMKVKVGVSGFFVDKALESKLEKKPVLNIDVLKDSNLVKFYAAKKLTAKLKGSFDIAFLSSSEHTISVAIPIA